LSFVCAASLRAPLPSIHIDISPVAAAVALPHLEKKKKKKKKTTNAFSRAGSDEGGTGRGRGEGGGGGDLGEILEEEEDEEGEVGGHDTDRSYEGAENVFWSVPR
jgi:hypothetical protein